jgi:putative ABC transport system permease protein
MKFIDVLRIAIGNLRRNKMRTILTVSGVVVGIGTIVFLVTLGFGLQKMVIASTTNLEALKVITITRSKNEDIKLNEALVESIKKKSEVEVATPSLSFSATVKEKAEVSPVVYGIEIDHLDVYDLKTDRNMKFSSEDASEVMVNVNFISALNEVENQIIGKEFTFQLTGFEGAKTEKKLKVIDIIRDDSKGNFGYTPISNLSGLSKEFFNIKVKLADKDQVQSLKKELDSQGLDTSVIKSQVDYINTAFTFINFVLGAFGMIALFVAAIGIFNTMTIALLERTHEIGVMKAIGGRDKDCSSIFIAEASMIGLLGGLFGVFSGWSGGKVIEIILNFLAEKAGGAPPGALFYMPTSFAIQVIVFAFAVSTFAGVWPAKRASKLNPLEALRYE